VSRPSTVRGLAGPGPVLVGEAAHLAVSVGVLWRHSQKATVPGRLPNMKFSSALHLRRLKSGSGGSSVRGFVRQSDVVVVGIRASLIPSPTFRSGGIATSGQVLGLT
jgi:hypothetical protein